MADLNITYHAYTHNYNVDDIKREVLYDFLPDNVRANVDSFLVTINEFNSSQSATVAAVKVPYKGNTAQDRMAWLAARLEALYDRMDQVRTDIEGNKQQLINLSVDPNTIDIFGTISQILSVIPVTRPVGAVAVVIAKLVNNSSGNEAYRQTKIREATSILSGYTSDVQQLNAIYQQVYSEYKSGAVSGVDTTSNAPKVIPTWYYLVGFAALILFLMIIKNRRENLGR